VISDGEQVGVARFIGSSILEEDLEKALEEVV